MKKITYIILLIIMIPVAARLQSVEQKLNLISNSRILGGEFIIDFQIKGTELGSLTTLASFNADVLYDSTLLRFISGTNWHAELTSQEGYNCYIQSNAEDTINTRAVRIAILGANVNSDDLTPSAGFDLTEEYVSIVRMNFVILDVSKSASIRIKAATNQFGSFINKNNSPNTFEILNSLLSPPMYINNEPLPVALMSFGSETVKRDVTLNWVTAAEIDNTGFDVERRQSGNEGGWSKIGFIAGNKTTNNPTQYRYEDKKLESGRYEYRLKQIDFNGNYTYFELNKSVEVGVPSKMNLSQNYPNPFNPVTKIDFDLPADSKVRVVIYDMLGKEVMTVVNGNFKVGYYTISLNAEKLSSGTYFYRLNAGEQVLTKKMSVVK